MVGPGVETVVVGGAVPAGAPDVGELSADPSSEEPLELSGTDPLDSPAPVLEPWPLVSGTGDELSVTVWAACVTTRVVVVLLPLSATASAAPAPPSAIATPRAIAAIFQRDEGRSATGGSFLGGGGILGIGAVPKENGGGGGGGATAVAPAIGWWSMPAAAGGGGTTSVGSPSAVATPTVGVVALPGAPRQP